MADRMARRLPYPTVIDTGDTPLTTARVLNNVVAGNMNVVGDMLLKSGTTETQFDDPRISPQSFFVFQHLSAPPAGGFGFWLKERGTRTALIGHVAPAADTWVEVMVIG